jgi:hypothetical protein
MITSKLKLAALAVMMGSMLLAAGCGDKTSEPTGPDTPAADKGATPKEGSDQAGASKRPAFNMEDQK